LCVVGRTGSLHKYLILRDALPHFPYHIVRHMYC
jgi:hypothetical protein